MQVAFLVEKTAALHGSGLTGVQIDGHDYKYGRHNTAAGTTGMDLDPGDVGVAAVTVNGQLTPPDDYPIAEKALMATSAATAPYLHRVAAWMEIWDYVGGTSFRAFMTEDAEDNKSLFVFFDAGIQGRDLKQALVALIELADGPLACSHMVICIDRDLPEDDAKVLKKGLEWAGFSLTTLDYWSGGGFDVTSRQWVFMGMEI